MSRVDAPGDAPEPGAAAPAAARSRGLRRPARLGDPAAFQEIYERHHHALYRYCRSILAHDEDALDALQNTMAKAFVALQTEQRELELRPWLFRIAHNESISLLRRRRPTANLDDAGELSVETLARDVEDRRELAQLRADLGELSERQRAALVLRELSGLSHEEIAVVLESNARAVKQTIFEARTALQELRDGRDMACDLVRRALSDGDRRVLRGRRLRSHLRDCALCAGFEHDLRHRPQQLAALVPALPAAAGAALLAQVLGGAHAGGAGTAAAATATGGAAAAGTGAVGSTGVVAALSGRAAVIAVAAVTATAGVAATAHVAAPLLHPRRDAAVRAPAARPATAGARARTAATTAGTVHHGTQTTTAPSTPTSSAPASTHDAARSGATHRTPGTSTTAAAATPASSHDASATTAPASASHPAAAGTTGAASESARSGSGGGSATSRAPQATPSTPPASHAPATPGASGRAPSHPTPSASAPGRRTAASTPAATTPASGTPAAGTPAVPATPVTPQAPATPQLPSAAASGDGAGAAISPSSASASATAPGTARAPGLHLGG